MALLLGFSDQREARAFATSLEIAKAR